MNDGLRQVHPDGRVCVTEIGLVELLYRGQDISGMWCDDARSTEEWQAAARDCDSPAVGPTGKDPKPVDTPRTWLTPEPYATIDLTDWCLSRCRDDDQRIRALSEIAEFERRGMVPVMRHMIYCVDRWRDAGVVWGVGRGSSVSSFVLHLIGINRINPMEHDLDFGEWLK